MKRKISPEILQEIRRDYYALYDRRPSDASAYLRQVAITHGINKQTLHRHLQLRVRKERAPSMIVTERLAEHDVYGRLVWKFINEHTFDDATPSITMAYNILRERKQIPEEITRSHVYASIKRQNLKALSQPLWRRFERRAPMDLWQIDFSKSRYFKHAGDGEIQICPPNYTKRQQDGQSLWFGVAIDDASRVSYVHYFVSPGEDSLSVQAFLLKAFEAKPDSKLLQGLPEAVYVDRGSGWATRTTENGLTKLGIKQIIGADEKDSQGNQIRRSNKKARGKVERMVRSIKESMEQEFYLKYQAGQRLTLNQFNMLVEIWLSKWNEGKHPVKAPETKWDMFAPALLGLKFPPEEALAYFTQSIIRKVIRRMLSVGNGVYCIAPMFLDDGESVEIIRDNAGHYVFKDGKRYRLQYQQGTTPEQLAKLKVRKDGVIARNIQSELKVDTYSDYYLRERFMQEFGKGLNTIPEDIWNEFSEFFESEKTVEEIKTMASWLRERLNPTLPSNVIRLPLQQNG